MTVDASTALAFLQQYPSRAHAALVKIMTKIGFDLQGYIQTNKLQGNPLHHRSGWLSSHVHARTEDAGSSVTTIVGVDANAVPYAAIHEYGGRTPPHIITPVRARALSFVMGGNQVFAKVVHHPGSNMPERSYLRSGLKDRMEMYIGWITASQNRANES